MKRYMNRLVVIAAVFFLAGGCSSLANKEGAAKTKKDLWLEKKKQHDQLYTELSRKIVKQGASASEIREKFGEPDDIFKSGSSTGSFNIWTYSKILTAKNENADWDAVMLYFNNDRLITWKY